MGVVDRRFEAWLGNRAAPSAGISAEQGVVPAAIGVSGPFPAMQDNFNKCHLAMAIDAECSLM